MLRKDENEATTPSYRHFVLDDWHVYVGKNDAQNDELSTCFARPSDMWMHVASQPGSHVIIQRNDKPFPPPKEVLEKAASLTAWFSKARHAPFVKVHVTEARNVHKSKNAPAGEVYLGKFKILKVKPVSPQVLFPEGSEQ
jgi:predicted ribosome quality control (RQC) complex YloA/Tae2 family protein